MTLAMGARSIRDRSKIRNRSVEAHILLSGREGNQNATCSVYIFSFLVVRKENLEWTGTIVPGYVLLSRGGQRK